MPTRQNAQPKPDPAPQQAKNPQPITGYKHQIRFPLPKLLDGLTEDEEQLLQILLVIIRRSDGCATPIETFISTLVHDYGYRPIKPDDIEFDVKTMLADWDDAVEIGRLFAQEHPELLAENAQEASSI